MSIVWMGVFTGQKCHRGELFMECNEVWLQWVVELQSIAQEGLFYGKDLLDELYRQENAQ